MVIKMLEPENPDNWYEEQPSQVKARPGITRRDLLIGVGGVAALMGLGCLDSAAATPVVRPPGAQNDDKLFSSCIRCEKCMEVCPHGVIYPSHIENGIIGTRTPQLRFDAGYCDWCESEGGVPLCAKACPTRAFGDPSRLNAKNTVLGKAVINTDWCLAYKLAGCRFCYDACRYEAISLDYEGRPVVDTDKCNGCGACESVCVSLKNGSIEENATSRAITVVPMELV